MVFGREDIVRGKHAVKAGDINFRSTILHHVSFEGWDKSAWLDCSILALSLILLRCRGNLHNRDTEGADDFEMSTAMARGGCYSTQRVS